MPQVPHAATKTRQSQINELKPEQAGIVTEGKFNACVCGLLIPRGGEVK